MTDKEIKTVLKTLERIEKSIANLEEKIYSTSPTDKKQDKTFDELQE